MNEYVDVDDVEERLYELYQEWAKNHGVRPTIKGYYQWVEEKYA